MECNRCVEGRGAQLIQNEGEYDIDQKPGRHHKKRWCRPKNYACVEMAEKNINLSREAMQYEHVLIAKDSGRAGMTKNKIALRVNN